MLLKFNCTPKFDQKVKIPSRTQVQRICKDLEKEIIDIVLPIDEFIDTVGNFIVHRFRVNVLHAESLQVELGEININAHYDSESDDICRIAINLVLVTHPRDGVYLYDRKAFDQLIINLADTLAHELIHMKQSRARNHLNFDSKIKDDRTQFNNAEYLSEPDEIDAFAYGIATDLKALSNPIKRLSDPKSITMNDSANLWVYINTFSKDLNSVTLKKLYKKIYKYLT